MKMNSVFTQVTSICLTLIFCSCLTPATSFAQKTGEKPLTEGDLLQIAVQNICPVMGAQLGSMGTPIKVRIGSQDSYLCCASCVGKEVNATHWKTIQTNIAKAQVNCPIMGMPVDASMESTVVDGRQIFVCCPPCIKKIQADTATAIAKVNHENGRYIQQGLAKQNEALQIAAQKICPVSGQLLGSMGQPVKVQVGESETAFLCCNACTGKKIDAGFWQQAQKNLAAAQGVCPVMGQAVDASMEFAVVNGRKIFVCCPPCIDKISKSPTEFTLKLNQQVTENLAAAKK